jgi:hypothetical protein
VVPGALHDLSSLQQAPSGRSSAFLASPLDANAIAYTFTFTIRHAARQGALDHTHSAISLFEPGPCDALGVKVHSSRPARTTTNT